MEETLYNHPAISKFNDSSLNTIRFVTVTNGEEVRDLCVAFRVGAKGACVDNISQGGSYAVVDAETGKIITPFFVKYIDSVAAVSNIVGFQIPCWDEVRKIAHEAALVVPEMAMVGWDICVTPEGPELIEGNHSFGCEIMQIHVPGTEDGIFPKLCTILKDLNLDFNKK